MPTIRTRIARLTAASAVIVGLGALAAGPAVAAGGGDIGSGASTDSFENGWVSSYPVIDTAESPDVTFSAKEDGTSPDVTFSANEDGTSPDVTFAARLDPFVL